MTNSTLDLEMIRDELTVFLRANDVLSTSVRGVTRIIGETYTVGVGGETSHTFAHTKIRDFVSLTVNSSAKSYLRDYTMNWNTGVLTWVTPLVQNDVVLATYDYGNSDKIFPDYPRDDLTLESFPRIGLNPISVNTVPMGLGGTNFMSSILIDALVVVPVNKATAVAGGFGGTTDLNTTLTNIRRVIQANSKTFYSFPWVYPIAVRAIQPGVNNKLLQQVLSLKIDFKFE